jgi:hypothetical protein
MATATRHPKPTVQHFVPSLGRKAMPTHEEIHYWVEVASWVATVCLAIFAALSLRQLSLLKMDMALRNERSAKEKAIEAVHEWAIALDHVRTFIENCEKAELPTAYEHERKPSFMHSSLPTEYVEIAIKKEATIGWAKPVNQFEAIAAMFMTGVADEGTGFKIIGRDYCDCIGALYDVIACTRKVDSNPLYSNIVALYNLWEPRLRDEALLDDINRKNEERRKIPKRRVPPLGMTKDGR